MPVTYMEPDCARRVNHIRVYIACKAPMFLVSYIFLRSDAHRRVPLRRLPESMHPLPKCF